MDYPVVNPEKVHNEIDEDYLEVDLTYRVKRNFKWFISNIFGRALSYLVGWTGKKALMLRCTDAGVLKTAETGAGFEHQKVYTGTSADAYADIFPNDIYFSKVELWVLTHDITFKRSSNDYSFDDEFTFSDQDYYEMNAVSLRLQLKSTVPGSHGTYKIIAWY